MPSYLNSTVLYWPFFLSCLPRWKLTPVTATEDNNDGRQSDSSPAGATAFLNRPSAAQRRSLKDTSTLTYQRA